MLRDLICLSVARAHAFRRDFHRMTVPKNQARPRHAAATPPRNHQVSTGWKTIREIIGEQIGIVLLQEALQPCAGHRAIPDDC